MRIKQLAAAGAAAGLVALGGAAAAQAAASGDVSVQPGTVAPGGQVSVFGLSCTASTGTATSPAFSAPIALSMLSNSTGGVGTVSSSAKPGTWPVTVTCGNKTLTGSITVVAAVTTPTGAAKTGDGAAMIGGNGAATTGAALAAGGLGLGALAVFRRRQGRQHG